MSEKIFAKFPCETISITALKDYLLVKLFRVDEFGNFKEVTLTMNPNEWRSVQDDQLPENKQIVLCMDKHGEMAVCETQITSRDYIFMLLNTSHQIKDVTYWRDLPNFDRAL